TSQSPCTSSAPAGRSFQPAASADASSRTPAAALVRRRRASAAQPEHAALSARLADRESSGAHGGSADGNPGGRRGAAAAARSAAWQPYPISIRVREWIEWLLAHRDAPEPFRHAMAGSISQQIEALAGQLEFHLMGNHLLENAITLCWAGLSFAGVRAHAWT